MMPTLGPRHRIRCPFVIAAKVQRFGAARAFALAVALPLGAQPGTPACSGGHCELKITTVATLEHRGPETEIAFAGASIALDSKGRLFVGPVGGYSTVAVYAPSGAFIRSIGRNGAGPGEFRRISQVFVSPSDTLYIMDVSLRRLSVFGPDLRFVRALSMFPHVRMIATYSGALFGIGDVRSGRAVGYALHEYHSVTGERLRSAIEEPRLFSSTGEAGTPAAALNDYLFSVSGVGAPLLVRPGPLRFLDLGHTRERDDTRYQPTWLPHPAPRYRTRPGRAATAETPRGQAVLLEPMPRVHSIAVDPKQHLLLVGNVPAKEWQGRRSPYDLITDGQPITRIDWVERSRLVDGWYDTMIELIDLKSGQRLASVRSSAIGYRALSTTLLARVIETEEGGFGIQLVRVDTLGVSRR